MTQDKRWVEAVARIAGVFAGLPDAERESLGLLCSRMMQVKRSLQGLVAAVDAGMHCASCGGACCVTGRYHFSGVDLLGYLAASQPLFEPLFGNGLCPYLGNPGCLMAPQFRPFNCITFNCELIEDRLTPQELAAFYALERQLRQIYLEIRSLFPGISLGPLL